MIGAGLTAPVADLGHGDGTFAAEAARAGLRVAVGVDRDEGELRRARGRGTPLVAADLERLPFRAGAFGGAISNCVLEHVRDLDAALREARRIVRPGGRVVATVVTDRYLALLLWPAVLRRLGLGRFAAAYCDAITRGFAHHRYPSPAEWRAAFERAGLRVVDLLPYVSRRRQRLMDLALPFLLLAHLWRRIFGRYVLVPGRWDPVPLERIIGPEPSDHAGAANLVVVAERPSAS